jgi:hypothetical protein
MNIRAFALRATVVTLPALRIACGGSDDATAPPQPVIPPASLTLSGTAATGAAIAGGTVTAKCSAGATTTATTNTDGTYSLAVTSGALPCVLKVSSSDGTTSLYSVANGSGSSATANITPLTQLVVARLTGADPAGLFDGFSASTSTTLTSTALNSAQAGIVATLSGAGIDVSTLGNLVTGTLTAATSTTTGNAYDAALDALQAQLAATTDSDGNPMTLATLTDVIAATSPAAPAPTASAKASLPADLLLKPAASSCSSLRSATYRVVLPAAATALADMTGTITIDAASLAVTYTDGSTGTLTAHPTEACRFTDDDGHTDLVVSAAGVIAMRSYDAAGSMLANDDVSGVDPATARRMTGRRRSSITKSSGGIPIRDSHQARRRVSRPAAGIVAASTARRCQDHLKNSRTSSLRECCPLAGRAWNDEPGESLL